MTARLLKKGLGIGGGVPIFFIGALLVLPPFVNLGTDKAHYLPLVEQAIKRKVDAADVRLRILPAPALRVSRLVFSHNPAFSEE